MSPGAEGLLEQMSQVVCLPRGPASRHRQQQLLERAVQNVLPTVQVSLGAPTAGEQFVLWSSKV